MNTTPAATVEIPAEDQQPVRADLYTPERETPLGVVVLCHGFKGFRRWGFFPYLSARLRDAGFAALTIDFSLNGTYRGTGAEEHAGDGPLYAHPDLFARNTLRRELDDVRRVLDHVAGGKLSDRLRAGPPVGLFGHSRGGIPAVIHAIERPEVRALCTWSTTDDPDFFTAEQKEKWRRNASYDFVDATDGTHLSVGIDYLNDLEKNHVTYHLARRARELRVPHLIVHGTLDLVVRVESARALHEAESGLREKRLVLLQAGHTFGMTARSPLDAANVPASLDEAVRETVAWFNEHIATEGSP